MGYIIKTDDGNESRSQMRDSLRRMYHGNRYYDGYRGDGNGKTYHDGYREGYKDGRDDERDESEWGDGYRRERDSRGRYM